MERRTLIDSEISIETRDDGPGSIVGYAARIYRKSEPGTQFELAPGIVERIMPGAFDQALSRGDDVRALFNHDPNLLLGRTKSGTLELSADSKGLKYKISPNDDTQVTQDVRSHIARGDLTGSSFAFTIDQETWRSEGKGDNRVDVREISNLRLYDVSPVTYPAYEATSVGLRAVLHIPEDITSDQAAEVAQQLVDAYRNGYTMTMPEGVRFERVPEDWRYGWQKFRQAELAACDLERETLRARAVVAGLA